MPRVNTKVIGLMKDENDGKIMMEFAGLRTKMYSYKVEGKPSYMRIKGFTRSAVSQIMFEDFTDCLFNQNTKTRKQRLIRSNNYAIYTTKQNKLASV